MSLSTDQLHDKFEPNPNPAELTGNNDTRNVSENVDYEPHPDQSLNISAEHQSIIKHITNLYCGSASEEDMQVYAEKSIYDDPYSYCDTRYKIAGQWYGLPKVSIPDCRLSACSHVAVVLEASYFENAGRGG